MDRDCLESFVRKNYNAALRPFGNYGHGQLVVVPSMDLRWGSNGVTAIYLILLEPDALLHLSPNILVEEAVLLHLCPQRTTTQVTREHGNP